MQQIFFVCNRRILSLPPRLPFVCTHVFSRFSFDCCMGTVRLLVLWICRKSAIWAGASLSCGYVWAGVSYSCAYAMDPEPSQSLTTPTSLHPCHFDLHSHFSSPFFVLETQNLEPNRTKKTGTAAAACQQWQKQRCWQCGNKVNKNNDNNMTTTQQPTSQPTKQPTRGRDNWAAGEKPCLKLCLFLVSRYVSSLGQCYASQTSKCTFFWVGKVCFYVFMWKNCACGHHLTHTQTHKYLFNIQG